jgi:Tol biopolymer transport system component
MHEWPSGPGSSVSDVETVSRPSYQIPAPPSKRRYIYAITVAVLVVGAAGFVGRKWSLHSHVLDLQTMQITKLTDNGRVREIAISPDGHYVAYALRDGIDQSLWMRKASAGSEVQLLAPDSVNFSGLTFAPDGNSIYFIRSEKSNPVFSYLCKMPATGGLVQQLIRDADSPVSFSPDGQRFVYTRGNPPKNVFEVRTAKADGSGDALLETLHGFQVYEAGATWSPDGRTVTVPVRMIGEQSRFVLYAISVVDGTVRELYSSVGSIGRPLWIRHGRALLVSLEDPRSHRGQLWTIAFPKGEMHRFTNDLSDY